MHTKDLFRLPNPPPPNDLKPIQLTVSAEVLSLIRWIEEELLTTEIFDEDFEPITLDGRGTPEEELWGIFDFPNVPEQHARPIRLRANLPFSAEALYRLDEILDQPIAPIQLVASRFQAWEQFVLPEPDKTYDQLDQLLVLESMVGSTPSWQIAEGLFRIPRRPVARLLKKAERRVQMTIPRWWGEGGITQRFNSVIEWGPAWLPYLPSVFSGTIPDSPRRGRGKTARLRVKRQQFRSRQFVWVPKPQYVEVQETQIVTTWYGKKRPQEVAVKIPDFLAEGIVEDNDVKTGMKKEKVDGRLDDKLARVEQDAIGKTYYDRERKTLVIQVGCAERSEFIPIQHASGSQKLAQVLVGEKDTRRILRGKDLPDWIITAIKNGGSPDLPLKFHLGNTSRRGHTTSRVMTRPAPALTTEKTPVAEAKPRKQPRAFVLGPSKPITLADIWPKKSDVGKSKSLKQ